MRKKSLVTMIIALALTASVMVGATLAYLTAQTGPVKNTFTIGNVNIKLEEPSWDDDKDPETGENPFAQDLLPGASVEKDPTVTNTGANDAYVAVTIEGMNTQYGVDLGMACVGFDAVVNKGWVKVDENGKVDADWVDVWVEVDENGNVTIKEENWNDNKAPFLEDGIYVYMSILPAESGEKSITVPLFNKVTYNGFSSAPFLQIGDEPGPVKVTYTSKEAKDDFEPYIRVTDKVFTTVQEAKNYLDSSYAEAYAELLEEYPDSEYAIESFDLLVKAYAIQTVFSEEELEPTKENPYPWVGQLGIVFPIS